MPKRSNDFQKLITFIEKQLAPEGVSVRESVMLKEIDSDDEREVDVLIEGRSGHHEYRIAVECRDHKRRQGKPWIDALEGRYAHLPVHKVIAVSRSGFTRSTYRRAETAKITLLTLEEAFSADWGERVANYRMGMVVWHHKLVSARPVYRGGEPPKLPDAQIRACPIGPAIGPPTSDFESDVLALYRRHSESALREWISQHFRDAWSKSPGQDWDVRIPFAATDRFLHHPDGSRYELEEVQIVLCARYQFHDAEPSYYSYNEARVATGVVDDANDARRYRFTMLFDEDGTPTALNVRTEDRDTRSG